MSDAAERLAGGPAKNDKDHEKFLRIAQEVNQKVPGLTETVWGQKVQGPKYPALDKDLKVDVVVIGAGISGLSIAYNLAKAGKKVAVLEGKSRGKALSSRCRRFALKSTSPVVTVRSDFLVCLLVKPFCLLVKFWKSR